MERENQRFKRGEVHRHRPATPRTADLSHFVKTVMYPFVPIDRTIVLSDTTAREINRVLIRFANFRAHADFVRLAAAIGGP